MLTSLIKSSCLLSGRWPRWPLWLSHIHLLPRGDRRRSSHQHGGAARVACCRRVAPLPRPPRTTPDRAFAAPSPVRGLEELAGAEALGLLVRVVEGFFTTVTSTAAAAAVVVVDQEDVDAYTAELLDWENVCCTCPYSRAQNWAGLGADMRLGANLEEAFFTGGDEGRACLGGLGKRIEFNGVDSSSVGRRSRGRETAAGSPGLLNSCSG